MKRLLFFLFILLVFVSVINGADRNQFWETKGYPIGFWNYAGIDRQDSDTVKDWTELGMNVAMSPYYYNENNPKYKAKMIGILDECAKNGIKVIVRDARTFFNYLEKNGEEEYKKAFIEAYNDFGKHPAVMGFHVGDEPVASQLPYYIKAIKIQKEIAPELSPYFNLLPLHDGNMEWAGYDFKTVEEMIDYICKNCPAQIIAIDHYAQMRDEEGINNYFDLLNTYHKAAVKHNIPMYMTDLSVPHFKYRKPTIDDLRWQLNTSFAHGANGVLWFFIYALSKESNYREAPVNEFGEKTQLYRELSYENRRFHRFFNKVAQGMILDKAYHINKAYGKTPLFEGNSIVKSVKNDDNLPGIISFFKNNYIAVVNNSQTESTRYTVVFGDKVKSAKIYLDNCEEKECLSEGLAYFERLGEGSVAFWLAPGQMEIFKLGL